MKTFKVWLMIGVTMFCAACSFKNGEESRTERNIEPVSELEEMKMSEDIAVAMAPEKAGAGRDRVRAEEPTFISGYVPHVRSRLAAAPGISKRYMQAPRRDYYGGRPWTGGRFNTESYERMGENPFLKARSNPLSTFSIDVDTASYSNVRRFLTQGMLPPKDAVRIEELVNYFDYAYSKPRWGKPFSASVEVARAPWAQEHKLVRVAIQARDAGRERRVAANLVFLLDVSGSMRARNKLPLVKKTMRMLVKSLGKRDRVAIVVYAGAAGLVLESTPANRKGEIVRAIERLQAGGSTAGGKGIELAYSVARRNFIRGGINRVILCTDGDFNVGVSDEGSLTRMIEDKAKGGVWLTVFGFGMGNYKDSMLEKLSNKGNGVYGYIDNEREARKYMVDQVQGTLVTVAKDVKIQVEFNPEKVEAYRLIGYENRIMRKEDFANDRKDAGDVGAGHCVTALYEVIPRGRRSYADDEDGLRYGDWKTSEGEWKGNDELLFVKIRHKDPNGTRSKLMTFAVRDSNKSFNSASREFKFAAAVAEFGLILRGSEYAGSANLGQVLRIARANSGRDQHGYRKEFVNLVRKARNLSPRYDVEETTQRNWRNSF